MASLLLCGGKKLNLASSDFGLAARTSEVVREQSPSK